MLTGKATSEDCKYAIKSSLTNFLACHSLAIVMTACFSFSPLSEQLSIEGKLVESTVSVRVEKLENDIAIIIEDDGVGIEPEIVNNILLKNEGLEKEGRTSLGIRNVNQRIQMVYGKEYGMQIDSILGIGTKITLRIKKEVK
ncbi:hypothetical protein AN643_02210 [Candidatus Epulonipiscioides saccharophilum]|nr:hypothetical protein AN643_02210 [Epulopiscium sp. SCG-B10WGA-EpuloB]